MHLEEILIELKKLQNPDKVQFKKEKFGIVSNNALGIYMKDLSALSRKIGKDSDLAIQLSRSHIYEAKILAAKVFRPKDLTIDLVNEWSAQFDNWEICDTYSMGVYAKSPLAEKVILNYCIKEDEFERRVAFATLAGFCSANKIADNTTFENYFSILKNAANDNRLYVKKSCQLGSSKHR